METPKLGFKELHFKVKERTHEQEELIVENNGAAVYTS